MSWKWTPTPPSFRFFGVFLFFIWLKDDDSPLWSFLKYDFMTHLEPPITLLDLNLVFTEMQTISFKIVMISIFALGYYGFHSEKKKGRSSCAKPLTETVIFYKRSKSFWHLTSWPGDEPGAVKVFSASWWKPLGYPCLWHPKKWAQWELFSMKNCVKSATFHLL